MRKVLFLISLFSLSLLTQVTAVESVIVADAVTGRVLVQQRADVKRPVASLTKVVTAMVVIDWASLTKTDLGEVAIVQAEALAVGGPNPMGLQAGDQITLRDALYSALLGSDNIAAHTLADRVGRSLTAQRRLRVAPVAEFVKEMNTLAKAVGAANTRFSNPHGLDLPGRGGVSTAADMAMLTMRAMTNDAFAFYVKQTERKVSFTRGGQKLKFTVKNTNRLLGEDNIVGVKTGLTSKAGQCLSTYALKKPHVAKQADGSSVITRRRLVCVVLGSPDRFAQTRALLKQGWEIFGVWQGAGFPSGAPGERYIQVPRL